MESYHVTLAGIWNRPDTADYEYRLWLRHLRREAATLDLTIDATRDSSGGGRFTIRGTVNTNGHTWHAYLRLWKLFGIVLESVGLCRDPQFVIFGDRVNERTLESAYSTGFPSALKGSVWKRAC